MVNISIKLTYINKIDIITTSNDVIAELPKLTSITTKL